MIDARKQELLYNIRRRLESLQYCQNLEPFITFLLKLTNYAVFFFSFGFVIIACLSVRQRPDSWQLPQHRLKTKRRESGSEPEQPYKEREIKTVNNKTKQTAALN